MLSTFSVQPTASAPLGVSNGNISVVTVNAPNGLVQLDGSGNFPAATIIQLTNVDSNLSTLVGTLGQIGIPSDQIANYMRLYDGTTTGGNKFYSANFASIGPVIASGVSLSANNITVLTIGASEKPLLTAMII
jgi:hypothetical protein